MNLPLNIDWHQILLHLFNFAILFAILYFLLYSPVKKFMDTREQHYKEIDDAANKALADAEDSKKEYADKLKAADAEIEQKRLAARQTLSAELEKNRNSAQREAEEIIAKANERAESDRRKILEGAQREIADMVTYAAKKIVPQSSAAEGYDSFLDTVEGSGDDE